jgi:hypothetical protein
MDKGRISTSASTVLGSMNHVATHVTDLNDEPLAARGGGFEIIAVAGALSRTRIGRHTNQAVPDRWRRAPAAGAQQSGGAGNRTLRRSAPNAPMRRQAQPAVSPAPTPAVRQLVQWRARR